MSVRASRRRPGSARATCSAACRESVPGRGQPSWSASRRRSGVSSSSELRQAEVEQLHAALVTRMFAGFRSRWMMPAGARHRAAHQRDRIGVLRAPGSSGNGRPWRRLRSPSTYARNDTVAVLVADVEGGRCADARGPPRPREPRFQTSARGNDPRILSATSASRRVSRAS